MPRMKLSAKTTETFQWTTPYLLFSMMVILITSYFSLGYKYPDEHFQIIEFMNYKLGNVALSQMMWEFHSKIRPWFQPSVYYCIVKPLTAVGVTNPFTLAWILRIVTGLFGFASIAVFMRTALLWFKTKDEKKAIVAALTFICLLPFFLVRTQCESFASSFFIMGLCLYIHRFVPEEKNSQSVAIWKIFLSGALLGFSFESRYQAAFMIIGLGLWLLAIARRPVKELCIMATGFFVAVGLCTLIDHWGYGEWVFAPWGYFKVDIIDNVTAKFGVSPFYGFLYILLQNRWAPVIIFLMIAYPIGCIRHPRHVATWVTLPFLIAHCMVNHKEARFLDPMLIICVSFLVLAFSPSESKNPRFWKKIWEWRKSHVMKFFYTINFVLIVYCAFVPFRNEMNLLKYVYERFPDKFVFYYIDYTEKRGSMNDLVFYNPKVCERYRVTPAEFKKILSAATKPVYIIDAALIPSADHEFLLKGTTLYRTFPLWITRFDRYVKIYGNQRFVLYEFFPRK